MNYTRTKYNQMVRDNKAVVAENEALKRKIADLEKEAITKGEGPSKEELESYKQVANEELKKLSGEKEELIKENDELKNKVAELSKENKDLNAKLEEPKQGKSNGTGQRNKK